MNFIFTYIGNFIIPTDFPIFQIGCRGRSLPLCLHINDINGNIFQRG